MANEFNLRTEEEREMLIADVWCSKCQEYNTGLDEPHEYEGNGVLFLEGKCTQCGSTVASEILN